MVISMYLYGDIKLWWHTCLQDYENANRLRIESWEQLKKELNNQFLPFNMAWAARKSLKVCVTRYESYEFLVMLFGLTNTSATFCNLMNDVLYEFLDQYVVVYPNNIVVYGENLDAHVEHLVKVFTRLRQHQLYVKKEKYEFCCSEMIFSGH